METVTLVALLIVLFLVLSSEFVNGWTDAPNAIACLITTRVMTAGQAIALAVVMNVLGTLSGTAVAETMGKGIVSTATINLLTISAALVGIIAWGAVAARYGIPTSESHALVAGLSGAALATAGPGSLQWAGWSKVLIGVASAVILGLAGSWIVSRIIIRLAAKRLPGPSKKLFDRLQILSGAFMAYNHGLNDGQKFVGVFTLALVMGGVLKEFHIPVWVILLCAITMGVGTSIGGKEIIGTLGEKIAKIESWQGFAALTGASTTILGASLLGIPLSTTHTIVAAVTGTGMSRSPAVVRWKYPRRIVYASLLTFPLCGAIAFLVCFLLQTLQRLFM
ncbi:MAG: inorganic phosphate transporter [Candidatus Eremiobacteraeota bacterium]|nr:inorganic phosphate transporter [Candidatus Eremiobacteraeota bacterium]